ncbi:MAG: hypothetical protein AB7D96_11650 [Arcobacteraceae bacterium]
MFKKTFFIVYFITSVFGSSSFSVGDKIGNFSLLNQFDEKQTIDGSVKTMLVSFEKGTGADVNEFLSKQSTDFLKQHHAVFIANISGMPMVITKMFALPKMRGYKHPVLLIYDENDTRFKSQEEKTTLYRLEEGVIKSIEFITQENLGQVFQ